MRPAALPGYITLLLLIAAALSSCGGGKLALPPPPAVVLATFAGSAGRAYAPPGTADPGTAARISAGGSGASVAAADGSFTIAAVWTLGVPASVEYIAEGFTMSVGVTPVSLDSIVTKPYFSTGQAPNDLLYFDAELYVANSLDNTVTSYSLDGNQNKLVGFPQFASPSYLGWFRPTPADSAQLLVARNGDNVLTPLSLPELGSAGAEWAIEQTAAAAAFIGPGRPLFAAGRVFVPRSQIATFGPTTYGPGVLSVYAADGSHVSDIAAAGTNCAACAFDPASARLYLSSSGELLFDEDFHPYAGSSSLLECYDPATLTAVEAALELGLVGASSLVVTADGAHAYIASLLRGEIYKVDLGEMTVLRGENNPIVLSTEFTYISDLALTADGRLLATSFNTDELYVIDTTTDTVSPGPYPAALDLALDPQLLSGAIGVELAPSPTRPGKQDAYVLYGIGNAVAKVELF